MEAGGRRGVEVAHRRWGKDDVSLHFTATRAVQEPGNYWHMLPMYAQARKVIWDAVNPKTGKRRIDEAFPEPIRRSTRRQDMAIELVNGSIWQLVGSDNYDAYVGSPPRGIVLSEWSISNPMAWAYLAPILEENGGWAIFIYTSRGNNHGRTMYDHARTTPGWFAERLPATKTPVFTREQLSGIKTEYQKVYGHELGNAMYNQEYLCSWQGAVMGAYFAVQMQEAREAGRVTRVPYRPGIEVDTFWDLGVRDAMAIWFMQPVGQSYNFIDYYEASGYGLEHYAKLLKDKGYVYGNHWMPHDAAQREMTNSEVALSRKEVAENLGIRPVSVVKRSRNMDLIVQVHIPAARNMIASCWFDEDKCSDGIRALENFRTEYDEEKKILGARYLHDWSSNGSMAFMTFAVGYQPPKMEIPADIFDKPLVIDYGGLDHAGHSQGWMI